MKKYYLISSEALKDGLLFRNEEDFKVGMNYVAILAAKYPGVIILVFILMSNHFHFFLLGTREEVEAFVNAFKKRYSSYYNRKYGVKEILRGNAVDFKEFSPDKESLRIGIAYVQMNCVAANICSHPSQYPWGTGGVFFNRMNHSGRCVGEFSARKLAAILHSNECDLPRDWVICDDGYVLPQNYVGIARVEGIFDSPKQMNYYLNNSSKAKRRLEMAEDHLPAFRDQTAMAALYDLCRSLFGKKEFRELAYDEKVELVRQLRYRCSANANQIARVCGISYEEVAKLMDGV